MKYKNPDDWLQFEPSPDYSDVRKEDLTPIAGFMFYIQRNSQRYFNKNPFASSKPYIAHDLVWFSLMMLDFYTGYGIAKGVESLVQGLTQLLK
jgi:hypothetical protein